MGQALYRKYRSKSLEEIVGQEHITDTLMKALKGGKVSHAYLFTGPRGVGKTSIARILAHELNNLPYDEAQGHIDVIEIDAASNNGVEDVRDLREKVYVAPAQAKYKVYIIDEVHMLSKAAFNALLKTLEEPPAHVVFILATTESHKLPDTIVSRTQRYVFRPIDPQKATTHLKSIAKAEKITIADDALDLVVAHGSGSFRDSISLLDQLSGTGDKIELKDVQALLGVAPADAISQIADSVAAGQSSQAIYEQLGQLLQQGFQPASIAKQLSALLRARVLDGNPLDTRTAQLLSGLLEVPVSHDPEARLEVLLLAAGSIDRAATPITQTAAAPQAAPKPADMPPKPVEEPVVIAEAVEIEQAIAPPETETTETVPRSAPAGTTVLDASNWQQVLDILKKQHNTLYGIVRMAQPDFSVAGKLTLSFNFAFHQKRANEAKNRKAISDAVAAVAGDQMEIACIHDSAAVPPTLSVSRSTPLAAPPSDNSLASISNIFGGGELLQSD